MNDLVADEKLPDPYRASGVPEGAVPAPRGGLMVPGPKGGLLRQGGGRVAGKPNKVTTEFRETIQKVLDANKDNVPKWIRQVAEGEKARYDKKGNMTHPGRPPNPAEAARLVGHLAEFAAPRLSRQEQVGDGGGPVTVVIRKEV